LLPGEALLDAARAMMNGTGIGQTTRHCILFVTDHRVGVFMRKFGGHDVLDFAFGLLTSVEYEPGIVFGQLTLLGPDEPATFRGMGKASALRVAQVIRQHVALAHEQSSGEPRADRPPGLVAEELARLARLRDSGVLSPEEFAAQKARLLA
jgi:hypothetical protein